jgi:hypothetical protein
MRANKLQTWGDVSSFVPLYWMIRSTVRAAQSGLNAEHFCGKATILVASDSQAKLKDFISPIMTDNGCPRSSAVKFPPENFRLMDGLSIFLERSRDEEIYVAKTCSRINCFSLPLLNVANLLRKNIDVNSFGDILACNTRATKSVADIHFITLVVLACI